MKKYLSLALATLLLLSIVVYASAIEVPSVDDLLSASQAIKEDGVILYDDFVSDFGFYCRAWDAYWNIANIKTISNDGKVLVSNIDGLVLTIDTADESHPILDAAVNIGSGSMDYKATVMLISLVAAIEHKRPGTRSERKALLNQVSSKLEGALYWLSLLVSNPKDGDSITAMINGPKAIYEWRYVDGNIHFGIAL